MAGPRKNEIGGVAHRCESIVAVGHTATIPGICRRRTLGREGRAGRHTPRVAEMTITHERPRLAQSAVGVDRAVRDQLTR